MSALNILPGTGRGTMRSMVEGVVLVHDGCVAAHSPSTTRLRERSPSPQAGRI
jgi:hypothetical protein